MTESPLDIMLDIANFYHSIWVIAIVISSAAMGYGMGRRIDSWLFCLAIAATLFFFSSGFIVASIGFNPLKIVAVTLVISRLLKKIVS
ncbi:hypothetical protein [Picosynechococcus sp. NKBG15041c]|uniref:hypothetical protein n=1 Tax=Picosynechococcus sp. NKBG15041c TaxID=1407650 RepID=UPI0004660EF2|nr:hypothetical protein [Picosynechococcus sp. NKBG15041c]